MEQVDHGALQPVGERDRCARGGPAAAGFDVGQVAVAHAEFAGEPGHGQPCLYAAFPERSSAGEYPLRSWHARSLQQQLATNQRVRRQKPAVLAERLRVYRPCR